MGCADRLHSFGDWRGAGLPQFAQAFRLKKNHRPIFPTIARQNVEIRDAPHAAHRRHLNAQAVLLQDKKRLSRQAGSLVRLIRVGRGTNDDLRGSPSIFFASYSSSDRILLSRPRTGGPFLPRNMADRRVVQYRQPTTHPEYRLSPNSPNSAVFREARK